MKNTDSAFAEALLDFFTRSKRKERAFKDIISNLVPFFQPSEIDDDSRKVTLTPYDADKFPIIIKLLAEAPGSEAILLDASRQFEEWHGAFSIDTPPGVLLAIAQAAVNPLEVILDAQA